MRLLDPRLGGDDVMRAVPTRCTAALSGRDHWNLSAAGEISTPNCSHQITTLL
jgi:hypothetical protein